MKTIQRIQHSSAMHWVGNGFPVRSVFDYNGLGRELSPFLLLDYAAPHLFAPGKGKRGVGAHPHKGFETVTIAYQGELEHRDSSGGGGKIGPGDVQWMTAGKGIIHEEFHSEEFTRQGGTLQMVQLWVNLRAKDKGTPPRYQTLLKADIPSVALPDDAGSLRVIAGEFDGHAGSAQTFSPIQLWDVTLGAGKTVTLPVPDGHTTALLLLAGELLVNDEGQAREADLVMFKRQGDRVVIHARAEARLLVMDGEPLNEPVVGHGPFVMNTMEEIQAAFEEFERGEMGDLEH
ncbi:pirin family protein [Prosthecobacter sp. SYSU 5D2]|uniref:pirin family protein n=1 Tax=Prosthecobacter sp. SYSU 5D2 TaxID=3134134 RepID=UPI0031FE8E9F